MRTFWWHSLKHESDDYYSVIKRIVNDFPAFTTKSEIRGAWHAWNADYECLHFDLVKSYAGIRLGVRYLAGTAKGEPPMFEEVTVLNTEPLDNRPHQNKEFCLPFGTMLNLIDWKDCRKVAFDSDCNLAAFDPIRLADLSEDLSKLESVSKGDAASLFLKYGYQVMNFKRGYEPPFDAIISTKADVLYSTFVIAPSTNAAVANRIRYRKCPICNKIFFATGKGRTGTYCYYPNDSALLAGRDCRSWMHNNGNTNESRNKEVCENLYKKISSRLKMREERHYTPEGKEKSKQFASEYRLAKQKYEHDPLRWTMLRGWLEGCDRHFRQGDEATT